MVKLILLFFVVIGIAAIPIINPQYQKFNSLKAPSVLELDKKPEKLPPLNLEKVFLDNHQWIATLSAEKVRTVIATGDVIPARSVNYQSTIRNNFKWPFEKTAPILQSGDLTIINLETPLIKDCMLTQVGMIFCGTDKHIEGLKFGGVDIVSLANNHAANYGKRGVEETVKLLNDNGILTTGLESSNLLVKEVRGIKFAFLGYNDISKTQPGVSNADEEQIKAQIADAKQKADIVIATFHWGAEYQSQPDARQVELAHLTIDSGADLVIGNHPHWIQPVEFYQGKLITYAHGNFIFDQMWSEKTKYGVVGKYTFFDKDLVDVEYFPIYIKDFGQPEFLKDLKKEEIIKEMLEESLVLSKKQIQSNEN